MKALPKKPKLKYVNGIREVLSIRLPLDLIKRLKEESKGSGYSQTEIIQHSLDLYLQSLDK